MLENKWIVVGGTIAGISHDEEGTPCQDAIFQLTFDGGIVAALADGAGTAKFSQYGAKFISEQVCHYMSSSYDELYSENDGIKVKKKIFNFISYILEKKCQELGCEYKDLASTLEIIAIKNETFILIHIGDGLIGYIKNTDLHIAPTATHGEFVNETIFTTSKTAIQHIKIIKGELKNIHTFIMMSDGVESSLYNKHTNSLVNSIKSVALRYALVSEKKANEELKHALEKIFKTRTRDDCSLIFIIHKDKITKYLLSDEQFQSQILKIKNKSKCKRRIFYNNFLNYIKMAKSIDEITRHFHINRRITKKRIAILMSLEAVKINSHGAYYSTITLNL